MHSPIVLVLLVFVKQDHARKLFWTYFRRSNRTKNKLINHLVSRIFDRALRYWPLYHNDLENALLEIGSKPQLVNQRPQGVARSTHRKINGGCYASAFHDITSFPLSRPSARIHGCRAAAPFNFGGDLAGGDDAERNKQLAQMRKMFMLREVDHPAEVGTTVVPINAPQNLRYLGLLRDLPLGRFSWCTLPHHQVTLNIWEPQYTLMFSKLLAKPGPHYYLHVLLPGGVASLGQPGYELTPGSNASLVGTLMRVTQWQREEDGRLLLVAQGLSRGVVLRVTQELPYSRGDVQILPDSEALLASARAAERYLQEHLTTTDIAGVADDIATISSSVKRRMVLAAAVTEARTFFPYEAVSLSLGVDGRLALLNEFNESNAETAMGSVADAVKTALREMQTLSSGAEADALYSCSVAFDAVHTAMMTADTTANDKSAESGELTTLAFLEVQVWLELDHVVWMLNELTGASGGHVSLPSQLLGLLPPPPQPAGWPKTFALSAIAARMEEHYRPSADEVLGLAGQEDVLAKYIPVDPRYPQRKRAERLSWVIWALIGDQEVTVNSFGGSPFQGLLEAEGTTERLHLALCSLRDLVRNLKRRIRRFA